MMTTGSASRGPQWQRAAFRCATSVAIALFGASCGPGGDPLVGRWRTTAIAVDRVATIDVEFTDTHEIRTTQTLPPHPGATTLAGCVEIRRSSGGRWQTTNESQFSLDFDLATDTIERTSCTNASDDQSPMPDLAPLALLANGTYSYSISGSQLTLMQSGAAPLSFERTQ